MVLLICCMINTSHMQTLKWSTNSEAINSTLVVVIFFSISCFPFWLVWQLNHYYSQLDQVSFRTKFGTAYEGLHCVRGNKSPLVHVALFYLRRALLAGCAVYYRDNLAIQIVLLFTTALFQITLISGFRIFRYKERCNSEMTNEGVTLLILYSIFIFTDFVSSVYVKFYMGYFFSACILIHLYVNIVIITKQNFKINTRRWFIKKALAKAKARILDRRYSVIEPDCKRHARRRMKWQEEY